MKFKTCSLLTEEMPYFCNSNKIRKIVNMLKKKNELLSIFIKRQSTGHGAGTREYQEKMEELLAALCLQSQRCYI